MTDAPAASAGAAGGIHIRTELRPGDLGRIIELHGAEYAALAGYDMTFEAFVCQTLAVFQERARLDAARLWLAEREARLVGSIAIVPRDAAARDAAPRGAAARDVAPHDMAARHGTAEAQLRWLVVAAAARGQGLGKRLLDAALGFCRQQGYASVVLDTARGLDVAGGMYARAGFRLEHEEPAVIGGRPSMMQRYRLRLAGAAG